MTAFTLPPLVHAIIYLFLPVRSVFAAGSSQCWYPDQRTTAPNDTPCDPNASISACCGPDSFCLGNGLCYYDGIISRASCTDRSWRDQACPEYCQNAATWGGITIVSCDASSATFVCAYQDCGNASFVMRDANTFLVKDTSEQIVALSPTSVVNAKNSSSSSSVTTGTTGSASSAAPSCAISQVAGFTTAEMAGVGIGVGLPLLLALIGALFVIRKQSRRLKQSFKATAPSLLARPSSQGGPYYSPVQTQDHQHLHSPVHPQAQMSSPIPLRSIQRFPVSELSHEFERMEMSQYRDPQELDSAKRYPLYELRGHR